MADVVMAYINMADAVMAYINMADAVMAYIVVAYVVMALSTHVLHRGIRQRLAQRLKDTCHRPWRNRCLLCPHADAALCGELRRNAPELHGP